MSSANPSMFSSACDRFWATARSPPVRSAIGLNGLKKSESQSPYWSSVSSVSGTVCQAVCAPRSHQNATLAGSENE